MVWALLLEVVRIDTINSYLVHAQRQYLLQYPVPTMGMAEPALDWAGSRVRVRYWHNVVTLQWLIKLIMLIDRSLIDWFSDGICRGLCARMWVFHDHYATGTRLKLGTCREEKMSDIRLCFLSTPTGQGTLCPVYIVNFLRSTLKFEDLPEVCKFRSGVRVVHF